MRRSALWLALAASPALAEIVPATPTEEEIFRTGDNCLIAWDSDTQPGGWKTMRIDLVSGTPPSASVVENVAESVGTTASDPNTYSWTCPTVDFDGPVYSYMFTAIDSLDPPEYSSQFTITGFTGSVDIPGAASASVSLAATSASTEPSEQTDVADPSQGAIHLGHHDESSGEVMLENVHAELGGPDSPTADPSAADAKPNFLASAVQRSTQPSAAIATPKASDDAVPNSPVGSGLRYGYAMGGAAAQGATLIPDSSPDDMTASPSPTGTASMTRVMVSSSMSGLAASASVSSLTSRNSTDTSSAYRPSRHKDGVVRALLFALCVGHFVL